jgi:adenylate cyclase
LFFQNQPVLGQSRDWSLEALGHWCSGVIQYALGEYSQARYHLEQVTNYYESNKHHHAFLHLWGVDAGLSALAYLACCLLCLGFPKQAQKRSQEVLDLSHQIGHAYTLTDVLCYAGCEFNKIRRHAQLFKIYAEELIDLTQEESFLGWSTAGKSCLGEALVILGQPQEGIPLIHEAVTESIAINVMCSVPGSLLSLAEAYASLGDPEQGMAITDQALDLMKQTGAHNWEAELYRTRSTLQLMAGDEAGAEASLKKALEVARRLNARWWELRAAIDLAHLWQKQGKVAEARELVKEVYSRFTEGFDTPELREARELCSSDA